MTNKQFLIALLLFAWMLSFCSISVMALFGAEHVATLDSGNPDVVEWAWVLIAINGGTSVFGLGQILKGTGK